MGQRKPELSRRVALVRPVPDSFQRATVLHPSAETIDLDRARAQHQDYVNALSQRVDRVVWISSLHGAPDSVFVEDQAVVHRGRALITQSGHAPRRVERAGVAAALEGLADVHWMGGSATLDGGDVLAVGEHLFVGQSQRTNALGMERLREVFEPVGMQVTPVTVQSGLHLKCACSSPAPGVVITVDSIVSKDAFRGIDRVLLIPPEEAYAANVLAVNGAVLMARGFPETQKILETLGLEVQELAWSEIRKADGSFTCMSIVVEVPVTRK